MKFKLKYQGGITKKICMALAAFKRKNFSRFFWAGEIDISLNKHQIEFDIISFSGKRDLEEQALSIYSFLFHVGIPQSWIVYSDGSYTQQEKDCLLSKFSFLQFREWNFNKALDNNSILEAYQKVCHLSKKLRVIIGHDYKRQTIYLDSDIVFYKKAAAYFNSPLSKSGFGYIADARSGDIKDKEPNRVNNMFELNSGLLLLNKEFNFEYVFEYLKSRNSNYEYFSEQSSFNYAFKKSHASLLDPNQFIVNLDDQFDFSMAFKSDAMSMRHYVTPVRHKMWQKGWRWHFN